MSLFSFDGQVNLGLRVVEIHIPDKRYKPRKFITVIPTFLKALHTLIQSGTVCRPFLPTCNSADTGSWVCILPGTYKLCSIFGRTTETLPSYLISGIQPSPSPVSYKLFFTFTQQAAHPKAGSSWRRTYKIQSFWKERRIT